MLSGMAAQENALDQNLVTLHNAATRIRVRNRTTQRFYHLVAMECAERLTAEQFAECVRIANEQLTKEARL